MTKSFRRAIFSSHTKRRLPGLRKELDVRSLEIDQLVKAVNERNKTEDERDEALAALEKLKEFQTLRKTATEDDLTITVRVVDMG